MQSTDRREVGKRGLGERDEDSRTAVRAHMKRLPQSEFLGPKSLQARSGCITTELRLLAAVRVSRFEIFAGTKRLHHYRVETALLMRSEPHLLPFELGSWGFVLSK